MKVIIPVLMVGLDVMLTQDKRIGVQARFMAFDKLEKIRNIDEKMFESEVWPMLKDALRDLSKMFDGMDSLQVQRMCEKQMRETEERGEVEIWTDQLKSCSLNTASMKHD